LSQTDVEESDEKQEKTSKTTTGRATRGEETNETKKPCFHAAEGSDAELKSELKSFGVPHWETPPGYRDELVDQDLVEHEIQEKHP